MPATTRAADPTPALADPYACTNSRQTTQPFDRLSLETTVRSARELANLVIDGQLIVDAPYQRGTVWTLEQRIALVRSWLQGIPVPAVLVNDRTNRHWLEHNGREHLASGVVYAAIDGRQRIETAVAWYTSQFAVPASWFAAEEVATTTDTADGPYVTYDGLSRIGQTRMAMGGSQMPMTTAKVPNLAAEADLYLLVNGGGTAQTDDDMANARNHAST